MIEESAALLPIWMVLSAAFGFLVGEAVGDSARHRKCLEQANEVLRDQLQKAHAGEEPMRRLLQHQRGILHDIHRQVRGVTKALQKRPS